MICSVMGVNDWNVTVTVFSDMLPTKDKTPEDLDDKYTEQ